MTTPLRWGFLFSGLLHVAVVAAFSISSDDEVPVSDEPLPLTLKLAMFEPPAQPVPAPLPPVPLEEPEPAPPQQVVEPPPSPPLPEPVAETVRPEPPKPKLKPAQKPRQVVRKSRPKPPLKPPAKASQRRSVAKVVVNKKVMPTTATPVIDVVEKQHYLAALSAEINRKKYYPLSSRRRGEEGRVLVRFVIQKGGEFTDLSVVESSGSRRLDKAALKTLRRVAPFRQIPESVGRSQWSITVPITFNLRG